MEDASQTPYEMRLSEVPQAPQPQMDLDYVVCIPSNGGTFKEHQEVRLPLNVPNECFVDLKRAYLKFKLTNKQSNATSIFLDPLVGGAGVIDNWRVIGGTGALLEEVIHYNTWFGINQANRNEDVVATVSHNEEGASTRPGIKLKVATGEADLSGRGQVALAQNASHIITHCPASGFFNADRYMPLGYTQGTSYVSITLAAKETAALTNSGETAGVDYECSEWELHIPILRPGPEFAQMFRAAMNSGVPIQVHSVSAQNTQQNISNGSTGEQTITFSTRKRSVKSLIAVNRLNAAITSALANSITGFMNLDTSEFNFSVGGRRIPSQRIKVKTDTDGRDSGELLANTQCALGYFNSNLRGGCFRDGMNGAAPANTYLIDAEQTSKDASKCAFALDLESYDAAYAGKNLASQGLPLVLHSQIDSAGGITGTGAVLVDLYVIHDVMYVLDGMNGVISANS